MSNYLKKSIDLIDEGLIVIDSKGRIKIYNQEAANIFGIDPRIGPGHEEGRIKDGDIVILVDNYLGKDDGNLTPYDLETIGIDPENINNRDAVVAIGRKGALSGSGIYKSSKEKNKNLIIERNLLGHKIEAEIKFDDKLLGINIDGVSYPFYYSYAAGNIVILDGDNGKIKFYQTRGYTARKEDIKNIIMGKEYIRKGPRGQKPDVYDKHISIYHPDSDVIKRLLDVANQKADEIKNRESIINGVPTRCTISAIKEDDEVIGAILKVEDIRELKTIIEERDKALTSIRYLEKQLEERAKQKEAFEKILGVSKKFIEAKNMAFKASESISNILLLGESGTGKNLFARAIHDASSRKKGPFIYINCASIPENLFESELFGYEKGSFTGALSSGKRGKMAMADGGTLFLDEIAELSLSLQAKFLHFLQSRTFTRVGGVEEIEVDVRFIFATNKNLEKLVEEGSFREDLFFRINVFPIRLPALKERPGDIPLLARALITKICKKIGKKPKIIDKATMELLIQYDWKGNIRELENVLERAVNISEINKIMPDDLPSNLRKNKLSGQLVKIQGAGSIKDAVEQTEKQLIVNVLAYTGGSRKRAMKILGIGKTAFYEKMKKYDIH